MQAAQISEPAITGAERETLWRHHIDQQIASGLARKQYCQQNNLRYHTFKYWADKLNPSKKAPNLVAVKLSAAPHAANQTTLCTLHLNDGRFLQIHDAQVLSIILEKGR